MTFNSSSSQAPFLPTSTWFPEDFEAFRLKFLQTYQAIANQTNIKQIGVFDLQEFLTGQQFFTVGDPQTKRQTFRKCFNIGAIAKGAASHTPHGITTISSFTAIYGTCITDVIDYRPIPYAFVTNINQQIELNVDAVNINIYNGAASPNLTAVTVVLEFLKN